MNLKRIKKINEKGQALLFVVVAVTIALAVGVSVSTRTLTSSKRVTRTDTSSRVIAASEGGIENLLNQPDSSLEDLLNSDPTVCNSVGAIYNPDEDKCIYNFFGDDQECLKLECNTCVCGTEEKCTIMGMTTCSGTLRIPNPNCNYRCTTLEYNHWRTCSWKPTGCSQYIYVPYSYPCLAKTCKTVDVMCKDCDKCGLNCLVNAVFKTDLLESDQITTRAVISVEKFRLNETDRYWFNLDPGYVKEVNVLSYGSSTIRVCWDNPKSAIYYISYNSTGGINKGGFYASGTFSNVSEVSGFTAVTDKPAGFAGCRDISLISNPYGLRIKVLYDSTKVSVFPRGVSTLPEQGYKLTSRGELSFESAEKVTKTIIVYKSLPYAPSIFDYGLYTTDILN